MPKSPHGFTLIEMMVVVAIAAVLAALSVAAYQNVGERAAPQNAAYDFYSTLSQARALAANHGSDVWVIVYPSLSSPNQGSGALGGGAYFMYEDRDTNFNWGGSLSYSTFSPPGTISPPSSDTSGDKLVSAVYLDDYKRQNAQFKSPDAGSLIFGAPFTALNVASTSCSSCTPRCTFCDGNRGAIVFSADGTVFFVGSTAGAISEDRAAGVTLSARTTQQAFLFAVSSSTAFITTFK